MALFHSDRHGADVAGESRPSWFPDTELPHGEQVPGSAAFKTQRQAHADTIAWALRSQHQLDRVPALVQDFLFGPWALVLAHVELTGGADARCYEGAVSDLLWSVQRDVNLRSPAEWLKRVPPLLATLREGLSVLGEPGDAHEPFFDGLMKLHRPMLQLRRARSRRDACDTAAGDFEETVPSLSAALAVEAGECVSPATHDAVNERPQAAGEDGGTLVADLQPGQAAQLCCDGRWVSAQLSWVSSERSFFLFVSSGGRQHSMTRRTCERLIRAGQLRLLPAANHAPSSDT